MNFNPFAILIFWLLYAILNLIFGLFFFRRGEYAVTLIFLSGLLMAIYFFVYVLVTYKRVRLRDNKLVVRKLIGSPRTLEMAMVTSWKEIQTFTRGMRSRRLTLYFGQEKKLQLNDRDHTREYEDVHHYLRVNLRDREQE
jgi:hypothetical protein